MWEKTLSLLDTARRGYNTELRPILCLFEGCTEKEREQLRSNFGGGGVLGKIGVWNKQRYWKWKPMVWKLGSILGLFLPLTGKVTGSRRLCTAVSHTA